MNKVLINTILLLLAILYGSVLYSQKKTDQNYYLIDSIDLSILSEKEKTLIDTSLVSFHRATQDTLKAKIINSLVAYSSNEKIWPKYNAWLTNFTTKKIETPNLSAKEKDLLINIKALTLNNEGYRLKRKSRYKEALEVYFRSLAALEKIGDKNGQSNVLNNIGSSYKSLGEISKALEYYEKSLVLKKSAKNKKGEAYTLNNIAIIYRNLGDINKSLETYFSSLKVLESLNDKRGIAAVHNNIAAIYEAQGNKKKAKDYLEKSIALNYEIDNKASIANTLNHLAFIYKDEGNNDKCLEYIKKGLDLYKEIDDESGIASSLRELAIFYIESNHQENAVLLLNESLEILNRINEKEGQIKTLNILGKYYLDKNNIQKAKAYMLTSMQLSKELGFPREIKTAAKILATIYEKEKDFVKAYKMQKLYVKMHDSIRNKSIHESILKQQAKFDISKKEQEIKVLSAQNDLLKKDKQLQEAHINKNRVTIVLISLALVLVIVLMFIYWKWNEKKKKIYQLLKAQKEEISLKNDEKTAMLQEIHHRVKNNLQTVNSLLSLQAKDIKDPEIVAKFKETQKRIITIASLHEKMYGTDNLKHIDVKEHLTSLTKDLVNTYAVDKNIQLSINIDPVTFGIKTLVPLGLIINEVVINSLKYAFVGKRIGEISIQLKALGKQSFEMLIKDDGMGLNKDTKKGLGSRLIKIFTKQLRGKVEQINHTGLGYKIVFHAIDDLNF
ncbi:tetratricopeptide repeat protein [Pseudofulvibacter geojedonensis]|uniref:Tetratricopeptide repeat protein n=1 Tax=Pseudofulvibacter geojedonensis TaxID=1123758 RepID=A0ABW3I0U8_9FLAO